MEDVFSRATAQFMKVYMEKEQSINASVSLHVDFTVHQDSAINIITNCAHLGRTILDFVREIFN